MRTKHCRISTSRNSALDFDFNSDSPLKLSHERRIHSGSDAPTTKFPPFDRLPAKALKANNSRRSLPCKQTTYSLAVAASASAFPKPKYGCSIQGFSNLRMTVNAYQLVARGQFPKATVRRRVTAPTDSHTTYSDVTRSSRADVTGTHRATLAATLSPCDFRTGKATKAFDLSVFFYS